MQKLFGLSTFCLVSLSFLLSACGDSKSGEPLGNGYRQELTDAFGPNGSNYCEETRILVMQALGTHLTKTIDDLPQIYSDTWNRILNRCPGFDCDSYDGLRDRAVGNGKIENAEERLQGCDDFVAYSNYLDNTGHRIIFRSSEDQNVKDHPELFHIFLQIFMSRLDPHSRFEYLSGEPGYSFGLRLDTEPLEYYFNRDQNYLEVTATQPNGPLQVGDQIDAVVLDDEIRMDMSDGLKKLFPNDRYSIHELVNYTSSKKKYPILSDETDPREAINQINFFFNHFPTNKIKVLVRAQGKGDAEVITLYGGQNSREPLTGWKILDKSTIYLRLFDFGVGLVAETRASLIAAFEALERQNNSGITATTQAAAKTTVFDRIDSSKVKLVLDLRFNPGGSNLEVQTLTSVFLRSQTASPQNVILTQLRFSRQAPDDQRLLLYPKNTSLDRFNLDSPMVVLQNSRSASAAEILSAQLQQSGRAKIVGETSFGKGIGQSYWNYPDTFLKGGIWTTTFSIIDMNGRNHQRTGVPADIEAKNSVLDSFKSLNPFPKQTIFKEMEYETKLNLTHWVIPTADPIAPLTNYSSPVQAGMAGSSTLASVILPADLQSNLNKDTVLETALQYLASIRTEANTLRASR